MPQILLRKMITVFAVLLFFCGSAFAQLSDFALTVTAANESCTANGVLNFSVSNTTAGAAIVYRIFQLPNTATPIAVTSANTFTGLTAGNYRVVATQSLGSASNQQQQDISILNVIVPFSYTLTGQKVVCGNDGRITVNTFSGTAVSYEIFSGPVTRPLQASNVFDLLPTGNYGIRVFNNCGNGLVQNYTLTAANTTLTLQGYDFLPLTCGTVKSFSNIATSIPNDSEIAYPLSALITVYPPSGPAQQFTQNNITNGTPTQVTIEQIIPLYYNQAYQYSIRVTDRCGHVYNSGPQDIFIKLELGLQSDVLSCTESALTLGGIYYTNSYTVAFLSAPPGFNPALFNLAHPGPFIGMTSYLHPTIPLPSGTYQIRITDTCGRTATNSITITPYEDTVYVNNAPGCAIGQGSVAISYDLGTLITSAAITAAPSGYGHPLPHTVTAQGSNILLSALPAGNYEILIHNECGGTDDVPFSVEGYQITSNGVNVIEECNSFNISLSHESNSIGTRFWLQKYNPADNSWGHPQSGYSGGTLPDFSNSIFLYNDFTTTNLNFSGTFRVVKSFLRFNETGPETSVECAHAIHTFEYSGQPEITDVYSFACSNGMLDVVVIADGIGPLTYRITQKNGQPFAVNNGLSSIFLGLEPAVYNFQVQDACGNILNSLYDISQPVAFEITAAGFCQGQAASLTVPAFAFLSYQWWKGNNTTNILSTTNQLSFTPFNPANDNGIYHVRIYYQGNPNSCIDITLNYQLNFTPERPNAGNDASVSYCGSPGTVDLSGLLSGNFDTNGSWQEVSSGGGLSGHLWNAGNAMPGNYQFSYTVTDLCHVSDQALISIQLKPMPDAPVAFLEQAVCEHAPLQLLATTVPFGTYQWSGPNGFVSAEQNPVIEEVSGAYNGTYTVKVVADGCQSAESSIVVSVDALPEVTVSGGCENERFIVRATAIKSTLDQAAMDFAWSGPNQFTSTENPIDITGGTPGLYTVTVTTAQGCPVSVHTEVTHTFCNIPPGISPNGDTKNDSLDLSGMGILKFKIYSRYGRMVFEQDNYSNQWRGQDFNGNELPDATYYYYIRLDNGIEKTGWVYVNR